MSRNHYYVKTCALHNACPCEKKIPARPIKAPMPPGAPDA